MDQADTDVVAREIDCVNNRISHMMKYQDVQSTSPLGRAMAFTLAAAREVVHDGKGQEDFESLMLAAWQHVTSETHE